MHKKTGFQKRLRRPNLILQCMSGSRHVTKRVCGRCTNWRRSNVCRPRNDDAWLVADKNRVMFRVGLEPTTSGS